MADIEVHRTHNLGLAGARKVADQVAESLGKKFDLKGSWSGNVLNFQRTGVSGTLSVTDKDLDLSVTLGFLLKALKGSLQGAIDQQLDDLLAKAKAAAPKPAKASTATKKPDSPRKKGG
jgi:putative polyhydroxyalkanoate system protein